jgi:polysaccharide export outer membrane protein
MFQRTYGQLTVMLAGVFLSFYAYSAPYLVNPGDLLRINVWNDETLSGDVLVLRDGVISLPFGGEIDTSSSSPSEVGNKITQVLGQYLKSPPRVVVSLIDVAGNKIHVLGKVPRPGEFKMTSDTDVMQALALAGGLNTYAAENHIRNLRRDSSGTQESIRFEYADVKAGKSLQSNIILNAQDIVVVP